MLRLRDVNWAALLLLLTLSAAQFSWAQSADDELEGELSAPAETTATAPVTATPPPAAASTPEPAEEPTVTEPATTAETTEPPAATEAAPAEKPKAKKKKGAVEVSWYKPEIGLTNKKKRVRVNLLGTAQPGTKIKIAEDKIPLLLKGDKVVTVDRKNIIDVSEVTADNRGVFELQLDLPYATAQLPLAATLPTGASRRYQINLAVSKDDVSIKNQQNVVKSPYARRTWGIWGGLGFNYLKYEQSSGDIPSGLTLESFDMPSLFGKVAYSFNKEWGFQATANQSPGKTSSSDSVRVAQGTYNWTFLTGEFNFYPPTWKFKYKKYFSEIGLRWGAQYHMVPFMARSSASNPAETSVETNDLFMFALGAEWLVHYDRYWMLETYFRYQVPYATGSLFDISPNFAFDGSVGVIYKWTPDWRVGAFWYGQWHDYAFKNHDDVYNKANSGTNPITGDQTLFFSNIEARIGWEFD